MAEPGVRKSRVSIQNITRSQSKTRSLAAVYGTQHGKSLSRMKVRKTSYGFTSVPGIRPLEKTSQIGIEFKRPPLIFLPTYQLSSYHPFNEVMIRKMILLLIDEHFVDHKYNAQETPQLAMCYASEVMRRVKAMNFNRYRIITVITIGQKRAQSYNNAVTFLWDHERDNYVDVQREVTTAFIQGSRRSVITLGSRVFMSSSTGDAVASITVDEAARQSRSLPSS